MVHKTKRRFTNEFKAHAVTRKLQEMATALKLERVYDKKQILEAYLNTVPFLYNVFGIEMAARTYFNKPAAKLDAAEAATLVGMLKGTSYYNPIVHPDRALARRNLVLGQMAEQGFLAAADYRRLRERPLNASFNRPSEGPNLAPHFTEYVRKWLLQWADENDYDVYADGLVVQTTLDLNLQQLATRAVAREAEALQNVADVEWSRPGVELSSSTPAAYAQMRNRLEPFRYFWNSHSELADEFIRESAEYRKTIAAGSSDARALARLRADSAFMRRLRAEKTRLEAGFVAMDPSTGEIRAWVGSRDFARDQFDHVAQAARQPGSTFKPIVYGAALERGLDPNRVYYDRSVAIPLTDGTSWNPTDVSGMSGQPMTLREGLIYSKNTVTAQVMRDVGVPGIVQLAKAVGVSQSRLDPVPSLALGTSPVTLLEMVNAYATIAKLGEYHPPVFVTRITDRHGKVLAQFGSAGRRAMSEESAVELLDMMRGVVNRGTGTAVKTRFGIWNADIAGKTGTTQNNTDGWFILMHPQLVAGAWVGFNDSRVTMRSNYWGQGGHNAILLVGDFFRDALKSGRFVESAQFPRSRRAVVNVYDPSAQEWNNQVDRSLWPRLVQIFRSEGGTATVELKWSDSYRTSN